MVERLNRSLLQLLSSYTLLKTYLYSHGAHNAENLLELYSHGAHNNVENLLVLSRCALIGKGLVRRCVGSSNECALLEYK